MVLSEFRNKRKFQGEPSALRYDLEEYDDAASARLKSLRKADSGSIALVATNEYGEATMEFEIEVYFCNRFYSICLPEIVMNYIFAGGRSANCRSSIASNRGHRYCRYAHLAGMQMHT